MKKHEPPIHFGSLYVLINMIFQIASIIFLPLMALIVSYASFQLSLDDCTKATCTSVPRAGAFIQFVGIVYIFVEEFWFPRATDLADELDRDISINIARQEQDSEKIAKLLDQLLFWTKASRQLLIRSVEFILVASGTLINGFGDILVQTFL